MGRKRRRRRRPLGKRSRLPRLRRSPRISRVNGSAGVPEGAVRGDGSATCPPEFPVKGNAQSMIYHTVESRVYGQAIAELCFSSPEAAEAAGYRSPRNL